MASIQDTSTFELRLVVRDPVGPSRDVVVEVDGATLFDDLVHALSAHLGLRSDSRGFVVRTGSWPRGSDPVGSIGLRHGDQIILGSPNEMSRRGSDAGRQLHVELAELEVIGGPMAGLKYGLTAGEHLIGRGAECDIAIEDPSLSRNHLRITVSGDALEVTDLRSTNGSAIDSKTLVADMPTRLEQDDVVTIGRTLLQVRRGRERPPPLVVDDTGQVPFNRPPRVEPPRRTPDIRLGSPPDEPSKARLPLAASLAPLVMGGIGYLVLHSATMLIFMGLSPVMAVWSFVEDRRGGKRAFRQRSAAFRRELDEAGRQLAEAVDQEAEWRRRAAPPATELIARARGPLPSLWERRPDDPDFLALRLGSGDQAAGFELAIDERGSETLRAEAKAIGDRHAMMHAVPVVVAVPDAGVVGLCGSAERTADLTRFIVAQAATLHSPRDVVVCAAVADESEWSWLKWLPHTGSSGSPIEQAHLAAGEARARQLVDGLQKALNDRRASAGAAHGTPGKRPAILVFLDESVAPERSALSDLLGDRGAHGIFFVWLGSTKNALPLECGAVVEVDPQTAKLTLTDVATGLVTPEVSADGLRVELATELALALAPLRDVGSVSARRRLPARVSLPELLGVESVGAEWIASRWNGQPSRSPVGATAEGAFALDLRRDGPHALIAGTTGSGKSELLQTLVASLACSNRPDRLVFLLVDYKGGAAFKECTTLPHTVGFITDLDDHLTQRALLSLNAELRYREETITGAGYKDLMEMEKRDLSHAPPSLVIVIDEFATLAKEVPEFVQGVVDVAQRGRSLGVHLVLATQRPAGVVTDNIRANTNLRIALRVSESAESVDVIGTGDSARIPREAPGRAFVRTGHSELTEIQAAYVGGTARRAAEQDRVKVAEFTFSNRSVPPAVSETSSSTTWESDLQRIVRVAGETASAQGIPAQRSPWLAPLPEVIPLRLPAAPVKGGDSRAAVGVIDEPAFQRQRNCVIDLEQEGNLLVFGTSGSGKTVLLRALAATLSAQAAAHTLHLYALDFATRGLLGLEALPHCGSVIVGEDEERVARLFSLLQRTVVQRRDRFATVGATSLSEYRRIAGAAEPRIVVLLDGYAGFAAAFERVNHGALIEALPRLVADGRPFGVHFVITGERRASIPGSLYGIVQRKIILRLANEDEHGALGVDMKVARGAHLPPGRGFVDNRLELQCAILGSDVSGEGQAAALAELATSLAHRHTGDRGEPAPIELLPLRVEQASLPGPTGRLQAVIGIGETDLAPLEVSLALGHFLVAGPYRSGRSTALGAIARSLHRYDPLLELHLLAPRRSPLVELDLWRSVASGAEECAAAASSLVSKLDEAPDRPLVVVVDDGTELLDGPAALGLDQLVRRGRDSELRVVAAGETQATQRAFSGWIREIRKDEYGLLLSPQDGDGDLLNVRLPRKNSAAFPVGRCYVVRRGEIEIVQIAD